MPPALAANLHEILNSENPLTQSDQTALETAVSGSQLTEVRQGVGDLARRVETGESPKEFGSCRSRFLPSRTTGTGGPYSVTGH